MPTTADLDRYQPYFLALLRIVAALLFMEHGTQKLFGFPGTGHSVGPYNPFTLSGIGGLLEVFGGMALLLGLFTRPVAFLLSGQMAVAFWYIHFPRGFGDPLKFFPAENGGDAAALFCFVFLYLVFAGPGAWSVDAIRAQGRAQGA